MTSSKVSKRSDDHPGDVAGQPDWNSFGLPKHKRLQLLLEDEIRRGAFGTGDQLPTEKDLMEEHGLSHGTVSRAVRQMAAAGLVTRARKRGTFVTCPPYRFTSSFLSPPASSTLAFFNQLHGGMPNTFHPFFTTLFNGLVQAADRYGMTMKFVETHDDGLGVHDRLSEHYGITGGAIMSSKKNGLEAALQQRFPVVFLSTLWRSLAIDRVVVDVETGVRHVMEHFRAAGHRRVALIDTRPHGDHVDEAIAEAFGCLPGQAPVDTIYTGTWTENAATQALAAWRALPAHPTAVFIGDDFLLMHFLRVAARAGLTTPRDLAVVGYGTKFSPQMLGDGVSLLEYDPSALADGVVALLVEQIREGRAPGKIIRIDTRLVLRQSG